MSRYEDRTVIELRELAYDRGIPGRSAMTKDQLIAALRGKTAEPEVEVAKEVEPEEEETEVSIDDLGPLQRAEYFKERYDATGAASDYNMWKQAELDYLQR